MRGALTVDEAEEVCLMGQPGSWDGHARQPLGLVPDATLRAARRWFGSKLREAGSSLDVLVAMRRQVECITLVLEQREANSPQGKLF